MELTPQEMVAALKREYACIGGRVSTRPAASAPPAWDTENGHQ